MPCDTNHARTIVVARHPDAGQGLISKSHCIAHGCMNHNHPYKTGFNHFSCAIISKKTVKTVTFILIVIRIQRLETVAMVISHRVSHG